MSTETGLLIHFNKSGFNNSLVSLEDFIPLFDRSIALYNEMGLQPFQIEDFSKLFLDPKSFLFNVIMQDKPSDVAGMPVSKEKLFELLEKPKGYFVLINNIKEIRKKIESLPAHYKFHRDVEMFLAYYEFDKAGKLSVVDDVRDVLEKRNSIYLYKESTKELYNFFKDLEKVFNESDVFKRNLTPPFINIYRFFERYLYLDSATKTFSVRIENIASVDNQF